MIIMFYFVILVFIVHVDASYVYQLGDSCTFNNATNIIEDSIIECGAKCNINQCKAFQFDKNTKSCVLFEYFEICQSNTNCTNKSVFINNRYNNLYESDKSGFRYKILNGINNAFDSGTSLVYSITDPNKASPLIVGNGNKVIMALGTFGGSKMIVYPKASIFDYSYQSGLPKNQLLINILKYFTNGACVSNVACYHGIDTYKSYTGMTNKVFAINRPSVFNLTDLAIQINLYNWHFIVSGTFKGTSFSPEVRQLVSLYGLCITWDSDSNDFLIKGNICQNITNYQNATCR